MRLHLIAAAGLVALAAGGAAGQDATLTDRHLAEVDGDDDGAVTLDEFRAFMRRGFDALDADADGFVTWVEAEAAMIREHFDAIDADGNGRMTPAELDAQATSDFAASDRDGGGSLN